MYVRVTGAAFQPWLGQSHNRVFLGVALICLVAPMFLAPPLAKWGRSRQRRFFWAAIATAVVCGFLAGLPNWTRSVEMSSFIAGAMVFTAYGYSPHIKIRGKIYAWHAEDRRPDSSVDDASASGRTRTSIWVRALMAVVYVAVIARAMMVLANIFGPPPHYAPVPVPKVTAVGPGVGLAIEFADGSGGDSCTAGFLVRTSTGQPGLLTAGHCNPQGGPSKVAIHYAPTNNYQTVGTFTETANPEREGEPADIGLVTLDNLGNIPLLSEVGGHSLVGVTTYPTSDLCHLGFVTNREQCGPVIVTNGNRIGFAASSQCGDSGGPVFADGGNGTATAVGILIGSIAPDPNGPASSDVPNRSCGTSGRIAAAELLRPWLNRWHLTLFR